jgi:lipoprotein-anchoring transpeptidase ErfK/SrfK
LHITLLLLAGGLGLSSARAEYLMNQPAPPGQAVAEPQATATVRYRRASSAMPAASEPASGPDYGGGFIELLLTGREPPPRRWRGPGIAAAAPSYPLADRGYPAEPPPAPWRMAALPDAAEVEPIAREIPANYQRQVVDYDGKQKPGTIVIDTASKYLYLVAEGGTAIRYGIGVGRQGFLWHGTQTISMKREWPDWRPPGEMLKRRPDLPRHMAGGPNNPLGARAMYLGSTLFRIHGTNEPHTIGHNVSSGCIRLLNEDVVDLYGRVRVGTRVVVI